MVVVHIEAKRFDEWIQAAERVTAALNSLGGFMEAGQLESLINDMDRERENG